MDHGKLKIHSSPALPTFATVFQILVAMSAHQILCDVGN
jgi:hypothetical protein